MTNWEAIKLFYVMGTIDPDTGESIDFSYDEIGTIFEMEDVSLVEKRAKEEDWDSERDKAKEKNKAEIKRKLEKMRDEELPDIVLMRRRLWNIQLGIVRKYFDQSGNKATEMRKELEAIIDDIYGSVYESCGLGYTNGMIEDVLDQIIVVINKYKI